KVLSRFFVAKDWAAAMAFLNDVSVAAEALHHHPDFALEQWRKVRVCVTTHAAAGLMALDFALARVIDAIDVTMSPKWLR
ncbi:transcriptional coactivator/pterin dehydratase, partial [Pelagophyceae sp. CCMP2097]